MKINPNYHVPIYEPGEEELACSYLANILLNAYFENKAAEAGHTLPMSIKEKFDRYFEVGFIEEHKTFKEKLENRFPLS